MPIKITSDSTCDLSKELLEKYDIAILPLTVTLGDRSGFDGIDITPEDIYRYVEETGKLSKTSAAGLIQYQDFFREWREKGYEVIHFNISSEFSSSHQNAYLAAQEIGGVRVVDSRNLSTGQGLTVLQAAEMAKEGASADEIVKTCEEMVGRVEASFVANSIDYLFKGGRCTALAALGANVLQIKPCIEVIDGKMTPGKKYRGKIDRVMRDYVKDRLEGRTDIEKKRIFITHTRCAEETVEAIRGMIREYQPDIEEILETTAGATITTHCGPGTLGVLFVRKN
ncbi:MAG: DegV family protein [Lachnospiraceae bacterium]|nr:DegV family protein [Lachnospiraceae bacterium]